MMTMLPLRCRGMLTYCLLESELCLHGGDTPNMAFERSKARSAVQVNKVQHASTGAADRLHLLKVDSHRSHTPERALVALYAGSFAEVPQPQLRIPAAAQRKVPNPI